MKNTMVMLSLLSIVGCAAKGDMVESTHVPQLPDKKTVSMVQYSDSSQGVSSIISNNALRAFNSKYKEALENKAFAQSLSGAWNWKSNRTSIEHAKTSALIGCQRNNKRSEDLYPCKVIHINDQWVE